MNEISSKVESDDKSENRKNYLLASVSRSEKSKLGVTLEFSYPRVDVKPVIITVRAGPGTNTFNNKE